VTVLGRLPTPLQDPAVATRGGVVYAFGGLDAAGGSATAITRIAGRSVQPAGTLPTAVHDAAAAAAGSGLEVFGGGQVASFPGVATYDPASRTVRLIGSLPTPLSDLATATVNGHVYVVGGYTGAVFSNRILEWTGRSARVVATLPTGLRYAAVAAVGGRIVIAGGRTPAGPTRSIYRFDPATGRVTRIGSLPYPLMHAAGGAIGADAYVVGGLGATGAPTRWILRIAADGSVRRAAALPSPLSDAGVAAVGGGLVIVGGAGVNGPVAGIELFHAVPRTAAPAPAHPRRRQASTKPRMFRGPLPGDLMIADRGNNRILIVNPAGRILWRFPRPGSHMSLYFDDDTFFASGGRRIISNEEDHQDIIEIAFPSGKLLWRFGHPGQIGSAYGYLDWPDDAYALPGGMVTVADAYNCRVLEIVGHHVVRSIGEAGHCVHDPPRYLGAVNGDTPIPGGQLLVSEINGSYVDDFTLGGRLLRVYRAPVSYPSDPQLTLRGNILLADYSSPGGIVILSRRTGRLLWSYRVASGPGELDHPSLATMLPNGDIVVNDDYNDRVVIIDPHTDRIVWQYGHTGIAGTAPGYLNTPDGMDFVPVTATGRMNPAAVHHP
jgi:outer membrane protein assembly factor BamB